MCSVLVPQDSAGEPLYKLFRAIKHQIEKGPVDARVKKAKYTLNDTGLLGDDVEYSVLVSYTNMTSTQSHIHHSHTPTYKFRNTHQKLHMLLSDCMASSTNS